MFLKSSQKAFSLVELLIAISIVALIAAVGLGTFSAIQKTGRDAQRQSDLNTIKSALQQFYADQNRYPDNVTFSSLTSLTNCTGVNGCSSPSKTYLTTVPKDTSTPYCYTAYLSSSSSTQCTSSTNSGLCHYYKLNAKLDNGTGNITCGNGGATGYNLEVTPL